MARSAAGSGRNETYQHPEADLALRPEVGTQPQFRKEKPPVTYRYDSSLSPALEWDGKNPVREQGEWLLAPIDEAARLPAPQEFAEPRIFRRDDGAVIATCRGLRDAIEQLKRLGKPFLNWAGKAEQAPGPYSRSGTISRRSREKRALRSPSRVWTAIANRA